MFFFSVAMLVSVIPEGLPAVLAIVLAIGVQRMAKRNAVIRHVPSVETLGVCDVICTDKTGTLTENKMTVREIATGDQDFHVTGEGWQPSGEFLVGDRKVRPLEIPSLDLLLKAATLCNEASIEWKGDRPGIVGDPTEGALVVVAAKAGLEKDALEEEYRRLDDVPFSSDRKYRAVLVAQTDTSGRHSRHLFVVGAYDVLLPKITKVMVDGRSTGMDERLHTRFDDVNRGMAERTMRVLCIAHRRLPDGQDTVGEADVDGLTMLGLVGMIDPPRQGVDRAIAQCRAAGIRVLMITGDQAPTAVAIARSIGLLDGNGRAGVATEKELAVLDDAAFRERILDTTVFARVSPATKLRIVTVLQEHGHTVAMTGDGVNDAPALKKASIGISMGISGTDVSKEVADMVLADDNFISIVSAIEEGRTVFQNVKNATAFLFMTNLGEVATVLASLAVGLPLPILPTQVLWMNLVTDGLPDIALATEPTDKEVLAEPPRKRGESILTRDVFVLTVITASIMCAGTIGTFAWELRHGSLDHARTIAFTTMAVFQLWNVFNLRSLRTSLFTLGLFSNLWVFWSVVVSFALQLAVVYLPGLTQVFHTTPLSVTDWLLIAGVTSSMLWVVELYKVGVRSRPSVT
jgi:Ca2+-transporting ATPase